MKHFAALFTQIDQTTKTTPKVAALADYFRTAPDEDKLWTIALFSGRRPRRLITTTLLREWAAQRAGIPLWMFEECYPIVGDLAETISLVLPPPSQHQEHSLAHWISRIKSLSAMDDQARKDGILAAWDSLPTTERFLFTKLMTGGFRVGISQVLMTRALSQATGIDAPELTHRLMGNWTPETTSFAALITHPDPSAAVSRPYPFYLSTALEHPGEITPADWIAERKWDGIRGQFIARAGDHHLWSRGEELITSRFPELATLKDYLPDGTVIDGEILAFQDGRPLPFAALQKRITRKTVPKKLLTEAPVILMAYDLLERDRIDIRSQPLEARRAALADILEGLPPDLPLRLSPTLDFAGLEDLSQERETAREIGAEGLMIKRKSSLYQAGRKKGDWFKWKVDPLTIDAVMIYAQSGSGRRANLFTDFTFAVHDGDTLVPVTKAYSGLTDAEFKQITAWVKKNTLNRFGPVRQVPGHHVFEIAFEGIQASPRHKSGIALRFPRMLRWRHDKPVSEANTLDDLRALLDAP